VHGAAGDMGEVAWPKGGLDDVPVAE
jgi:hypothetical protein